MTRRYTYLTGEARDHITGEARRLYDAGQTGTQIREALGLTEGQMERIARHAGLDLRARHHEARRLTPEEIPHGAPSAWGYHGCRCDVCVEARAVYKTREREAERARYAADPDAPGWPPHGTRRRAKLGCTCDACIAAQTSETRARQAETVATARNTGKEWTGPELEIVADRSRKIRDIAVMLGRTYASVSNARRALDNPRHPRHAAYTELLGKRCDERCDGGSDAPLNARRAPSKPMWLAGRSTDYQGAYSWMSSTSLAGSSRAEITLPSTDDTDVLPAATRPVAPAIYASTPVTPVSHVGTPPSTVAYQVERAPAAMVRTPTTRYRTARTRAGIASVIFTGNPPISCIYVES